MEKLADFFKLIADSNRFRIVMLLHRKSFCVCELVGLLGVSQPTVSKHLTKLRDKGYVKAKREERFIYYELTLEDALEHELISLISKHSDDYPVLKEDKKKSEGDPSSYRCP